MKDMTSVTRAQLPNQWPWVEGNPSQHYPTRLYASCDSKQVVVPQHAINLNYNTKRKAIVVGSFPAGIQNINAFKHAAPEQNQSLSTLNRIAPTINYNSTTTLHQCASDGTDEVYPVKWLRQTYRDVVLSKELYPNSTAAFRRFTIQDLIQQDCAIGSTSYPVDRPSRLVRIECRKPGCRCVLKNEPALSLKIVSGVTLVKGTWNVAENVSHCTHQTEHSKNSLTNTSTKEKAKFRSSSYTAVREDRTRPSAANPAAPTPIILSSCCPSWFEIAQTFCGRPGEYKPEFWSEVPIWSSCSALWRAKPTYFLLRKSTQCLFAMTEQPMMMSSTDVLRQEQQLLTIDADSIATIHAGTVLRLIDFRLCRLMKQEHNATGRGAMRFFGTKHSAKSVSMLQCFVVGAKALATKTSTVKNSMENDVLNRLAQGSRIVYIPFDSQTLLCSPVNTNENISQSFTALHQQTLESSSLPGGVNSILSLLTRYRLPIVVRPVSGLRPNSLYQPDTTVVKSWSESSSRKSQSLLQIDACYHGTLIFLEPLAINQPSNLASGFFSNQRLYQHQNVVGSSRFFVVTIDMLANHNFLVADMSSSQKYLGDLEAHALRVAQFLAASHPVHGLTYLLRHLEDITHSSNTGPSHIPLTRTLGPVNAMSRDNTLCTAVASVAAAAALATGDDEDLFIDPAYMHELRDEVIRQNRLTSAPNSMGEHYQSAGCLATSRALTQSSLTSSLVTNEADQVNALCDEIEDIYYYVRNGRFPAQSRSMLSLTHGYGARSDRPEHALQNSAPISPRLREKMDSRMLSAGRARQFPAAQIHGVLQPLRTPIRKSNDERYQRPVENFNSLDGQGKQAPVFFFYRHKSEKPQPAAVGTIYPTQKSPRFYHIPVVTQPHVFASFNSLADREANRERKPELYSNHITPTVGHLYGKLPRTPRMGLSSQPNLAQLPELTSTDKPQPRIFTNTRVLPMSLSKHEQSMHDTQRYPMLDVPGDSLDSSNATDQMPSGFGRSIMNNPTSFGCMKTKANSSNVLHNSFIKDNLPCSNPREEKHHHSTVKFDQLTPQDYTVPHHVPSNVVVQPSYHRIKVCEYNNGSVSNAVSGFYEHQNCVNIIPDKGMQEPIVHNSGMSVMDKTNVVGFPLTSQPPDIDARMMTSTNGLPKIWKQSSVPVVTWYPVNCSTILSPNSSSCGKSLNNTPERSCPGHTVGRTLDNTEYRHTYGDEPSFDNSVQLAPAGSAHQWKEITNSSPDTGMGADSGIEVGHTPITTKLITLRNWRKEQPICTNNALT